MAGGGKTLKITILGDAKSAQSAFKNVEAGVGGLGSKLGSFISVAGGFAAFTVGASAVKGLTGAIKDSIAAAGESAQVQAQTEAVLKSTGGAAGVTADQVGNLATKLSGVAPIDDEVIQSAENMLLTFTNVKNGVGAGNDIFNQATKTTLDMATALGEDSTQAAMQLGKALNDPVQGVTALQRVGVKLTEGQKEQVKAMVASGDTMGAQKLILAELNREFGGSAEAAGKTFPGQLAILKTALGNVQETIGGALLPVLVRLAQFAVPLVVSAVALLSDWLPRITAALSGPLSSAFRFISNLMTTVVIPAFRQISGWLQNVGIPMFQQFWAQVGPIFQQFIGLVQNVAAAFQQGGVSGALQSLLTQLGGFAQQLVPILGSWAGAFLDWIGPMIPPLLEQFGGFLATMGGWLLGTALPAIVAQLAQWGQALIEWIAPNIPPVLAALGDLLLQVGDWMLNTALPNIAAQLQVWGAQFIAWIQPQIGPMLAELGALLAQLGAWVIGTALPAIVSAIAQWGGAFISWVAPQIPPLLLELGKLYIQLYQWVLTVALPDLIAKVLQWGQAFITWVAPQIPPLLAELGNLLLQMGGWILGTAIPAIVANLNALAVKFVEWVAPQIPPLLVELGGLLASLTGWVIGTAIPAAVSALAQLGAKFVEWIADVAPRIPGALQSIISAMNGWIYGTAVPWAAGALLDVATALMEGLARGIGNAAGVAEQAARDAAGKVISSIKGAFGVHSPSTVMIEVGHNLIAGLAQGLGDTDPIAAAADSASSAVIDALMKGIVGAGFDKAVPKLSEDMLPALRKAQEDAAKALNLGELAGVDGAQLQTLKDNLFAANILIQHWSQDNQETVQQFMDKATAAAKADDAQKAIVSSWQNTFQNFDAIVGGTFIPQLQDKLGGLKEQLQVALAEHLPQTIVDGIQASITTVTQQIQQAGQVVKDATDTGIIQPIKALSDDAVAKIKETMGSLKDGGASLIDSIVSGVESGKIKLNQAMQLIPDSALPKIKDVIDTLQEKLAQALIDGTDPGPIQANIDILTKLFAALSSAASDSADAIKQTAVAIGDFVEGRGYKTAYGYTNVKPGSSSSGSSGGGASSGGGGSLSANGQSYPNATPAYLQDYYNTYFTPDELTANIMNGKAYTTAKPRGAPKLKTAVGLTGDPRDGNTIQNIVMVDGQVVHDSMQRANQRELSTTISPFGSMP